MVSGKAVNNQCPLALHILSLLTVLHTPRGECSRLAERIPYWQKALCSPPESPFPHRLMRRWHLLYKYWLKTRDAHLNHSFRRGHITENLVEQIVALTPQLAPLSIEQAFRPALEEQLWACFITPYPWGENYGIAYPLTIRRVAAEERIPPFHLSARIQDAALIAAGNLAIESLGLALGKRLGLNAAYPLSVDVAFPDDLRLTDESASLAFALAALKELIHYQGLGLAASGIVLRDSGLVQQVQGFELPYGKLEACFDVGLKHLILPWNTPLYESPKAGIHCEEISAGNYIYFFADQPKDQMRISWVKNIDQAIAYFDLKDMGALKNQLRARSLQKKKSSFSEWESVYLRLEQAYPEWLAVSFKVYFQFFRDLFEFPSHETQDWLDILRLQSNWVRAWLIYLLQIQASGLKIARQNLEQLWPTFPGCIQGESSLYLLYEGLQSLCQIEQKGPLPFRQIHQWLCKHQTSIIMLLNHLIQLEGESEYHRLCEGLRYNMVRIIDLVKSADFMFQYHLYARLNQDNNKIYGLLYQGVTLPKTLTGNLPVSEGGVFLEDPRTKLRFPLPYFYLCESCRQLEYYTPLIWSASEHNKEIFEGCEHAPVSVLGSLNSDISQNIAYGKSSRNTSPQIVSETVKLNLEKNQNEIAEMACIVHTELILNTLVTLKDPQQALEKYELIIQRLMSWLKMDTEKQNELMVQFSLQANTFIFFKYNENAIRFVLALHQLVGDYNHKQSTPSAHLQIRTGVDLGPVIRIKDNLNKVRIIGDVVQNSAFLSKKAKVSQILASENFYNVCALFDYYYKSIFYPLGYLKFEQYNQKIEEKIYTVYTRTTGVRELPSFIKTDQSTTTLPVSKVETLVFIDRCNRLEWASIIYFEIPDLFLDSLQDQKNKFKNLQSFVFDYLNISKINNQKYNIIYLEKGISVVFLEKFHEGVSLAKYILEEIINHNLNVKCVYSIGFYQKKTNMSGEHTFEGALVRQVESLINLAENGHLLIDKTTFNFLRSLDVELSQSFLETTLNHKGQSVYVLQYKGSNGLPELKQDIKIKPQEVPANFLEQDFSTLSNAIFFTNEIPVTQNPANLNVYRSIEKTQLAKQYASIHVSGPPRMLQNHLGMVFQLIEPGPFMMGSPPSEMGHQQEETYHQVILQKPFYMMTTPVTQQQWRRVAGENMNKFQNPDLPVSNVSWLAAESFVSFLNELGKGSYRLPTEAEWEYACRAGSRSAYCFGDSVEDLIDYAWFKANSSNGLEPVATRLPNAWGLYDMHGNIWEWVSDGYADLPNTKQINPIGPGFSDTRVIKGGRWASSAISCRSASRSSLFLDEAVEGSVGFRLVMEVS